MFAYSPSRLDVSRLENAFKSSVCLANALPNVLSSPENINYPLLVFLPPRLLERLVGAWRYGLLETRELAFLIGDFDFDRFCGATGATVAILLFVVVPPLFTVLPCRMAAAQLSRTY